MATLSYSASAMPTEAAIARSAIGTGPSFRDRLVSFYNAIIEGRARRAQTQVDGYLASLNDETLIDLGLDPALVRHPDADPIRRFHL